MDQTNPTHQRPTYAPDGPHEIGLEPLHDQIQELGHVHLLCRIRPQLLQHQRRIIELALALLNIARKGVNGWVGGWVGG